MSALGWLLVEQKPPHVPALSEIVLNTQADFFSSEIYLFVFFHVFNSGDSLVLSNKPEENEK